MLKPFIDAKLYSTDNSVADSGSSESSASLTPERNDSTSVNVPPKYGGELAEYLQTHNHEEIMERLKHVQLGDRTKYRWARSVVEPMH